MCEPGGAITVEFMSPSGDRIGAMKMEVVKLERNRQVCWRFREGPEEWIDTEAVFSLSRAGGFTIVNFAHMKWREAVEFTGHCSTKWATYLLSLKDLVERGKGRPSPADLQISEWH